MAQQLISMACRTCGGRLQVGSDTQQLACIHCGSEWRVARGDGIIELKPITEHLEAISGNSARLAAELAIPRLEKEVVTYQDQYRTLQSQTTLLSAVTEQLEPEMVDKDWDTAASGCLLVVVAAIAIFLFLKDFVIPRFASEPAILLLVGPAIIAWYLLWKIFNRLLFWWAEKSRAFELQKAEHDRKRAEAAARIQAQLIEIERNKLNRQKMMEIRAEIEARNKEILEYRNLLAKSSILARSNS